MENRKIFWIFAVEVRNNVMATAYNLDKLVSVRVSLNEVAPFSIYKTEVKIFGIRLRKEGVYDSVFGTYFGAPEKYRISGSTVFFDPHVILRFVDESSLTMWFNSDAEAIKFADGIVAKSCKSVYISGSTSTSRWGEKDSDMLKDTLNK